jgi:hypothetical protein
VNLPAKITWVTILDTTVCCGGAEVCLERRIYKTQVSNRNTDLWLHGPCRDVCNSQQISTKEPEMLTVSGFMLLPHADEASQNLLPGWCATQGADTPMKGWEVSPHSIEGATIIKYGRKSSGKRPCRISEHDGRAPAWSEH